MIYDNHGRAITYLRLAVTDRCNLRCSYCMPEEGISCVPKTDLLTYEEMIRLIEILATLGVSKVRITGGEPFVRKGMIDFIKRITELPGITAVHLTTNGTLTAPIVSKLKTIGIHSVNLSLDSLDKARFFQITRRNMLEQVMDTFHELIKYNIPTKINTVVMAGKNTMDIVPMVELTKQYPVNVRFIEEMPFNGNETENKTTFWNYRQIF